MGLLELFVLALVQGITEFLPISSSGHLILIPELTGWADQGVMMDVAVHVGTLFAVLTYFWRDTKGLTLAMFGTLGIAPAKRAVEGTLYSKLFLVLVLATIPVVIAGLIFVKLDLVDMLRNAEVIATTSIVFGLLLYVMDKRGTQTKEVSEINFKTGMKIGLAQILALIPGTSRSGITMTAALGLGFKRTDAARFSMLLAIPTILAAGVLAVKDALELGDMAQINDMLIGAVLSFLSAILAIHFLMRWLQTANMTIFVIYRVLLGFGLFGWVYMG